MVMLFSTILLLQTAERELLFSDDFQSGEIGEQWVHYGDPISLVEEDTGNPPPCFNNNGDSMWTSGVTSRKTFNLSEGIILECDMFLNCHPRGTWVATSLGLYDPSIESGTSEPSMVVTLYYTYKGELNWQCPHLQGVIGAQIRSLYCNGDMRDSVHINHLLNDWHTYTLEVSPDGLCTYSVDDSLIAVRQASFPDTLEEVGVFIGGRATDWGTALHDNLRVYRYNSR